MQAFEDDIRQSESRGIVHHLFGRPKGADSHEELTRRLREAIRRKADASRETKVFHRDREAYYRTKLSGRGTAYAVLPPLQARDLRNLNRLRNRRIFTCLVAETREGEEILGCLTLTLAAAEAMFPPPFPTRKPLRLYVSNIAVRGEHRRQGAAKALLLRAEDLAARWGYRSLWLHVDEGNVPAEELYRTLAYQKRTKDALWGLGQKRWLMAKEVPPSIVWREMERLTLQRRGRPPLIALLDKKNTNTRENEEAANSDGTIHPDDDDDDAWKNKRKETAYDFGNLVQQNDQQQGKRN